MKNHLYQVCGIAALSGLLFGYDTGVISGAILFIRNDFLLTKQATQVLVAVVLFGALLGSALSGKLTDQLGRKKILILSAVIFVISSILSSISQSFIELSSSRILLGIAIGIASFAAPLYLSEIAPFQDRGKLVSLNQVAITFGILASYTVNYLLADSGNWRWMLGLGVFPALLLLAGMIYLPESPRWLIQKGEIKKAQIVLESIRNPQEVKIELQEILESHSDSHSKLNIRELRPILWIAMGLSFFQQATGINTIIYYAPIILEISGFKQAQSAILATLGLGLVNVLATFVSLPLIDRVGRKPLLLFGLTGMCISLFITGASFYWSQTDWIRELALVGMFTYIISFAVSLGPICWIIIPEIFPLSVRGKGTSIAAATSWTFNMLVASTFLTLIQKLGPDGTFWLYSSLSILAWVFVYYYVPETKGLTLEEIEAQLKLNHAAA